jgi:predicted nucleic acid-binding protein
MILDTSFVIDIMQHNADAVAKLQELISRGEPQVIAAPTLFELRSGLERSSKQEQEKIRISSALAGQIIAAFGKEAAEKAGEIHGRLAKEGKALDAVDCMIAGTALARGDSVLTRNAAHFSKIRGLKVESY